MKSMPDRLLDIRCGAWLRSLAFWRARGEQNRMGAANGQVFKNAVDHFRAI